VCVYVLCIVCIHKNVILIVKANAFYLLLTYMIILYNMQGYIFTESFCTVLIKCICLHRTMFRVPFKYGM